MRRIGPRVGGAELEKKNNVDDVKIENESRLVTKNHYLLTLMYTEF